jgi:hypothetical protein
MRCCKILVGVLSFCLLMSFFLLGGRIFAATKAVEIDTFFAPMRSGEDKKISFLFTNISKRQSAIFVRFLSKEFPKGESEKWNARICTNQLFPTQDGQITEVVRAGESTLIDLCVSAEKDVGLNQVAKIVLELSPVVDPKLKTTISFYLICLAPKEIHLTIGQDGVTVIEGRALVPLRFFGESFGAEIGWDSNMQQISLNLSVLELTFRIGSKEMKTKIGQGYSKTSSMDVAPILLSNRTFVPLRVVAESIGATVQYDPATREIVVYFPPLPKK